MTFGEPDALYLLFALPIMALVAFRASRKRRSAVERLGPHTQGDPGLIDCRQAQPVGQRLYGRQMGRRIAYILWFAALAIAILALARPQWGSAVQPVEQRGVQMMVALDLCLQQGRGDAPACRPGHHIRVGDMSEAAR